ncbi:MAG: TlpA disulfide reductase family protein [Thermoanaerobaculia bacterium]|nr:TlpA disulfide reductase family protein [Thermoanaerobaculia bacterium]
MNTRLKAQRVASFTLALMLLLALFPAADAFAGNLEGLRSGSLSDGDLAQGTTIVVVWASWSPKCRDIAERLNALEKRWGSRARVVSVNYQEKRADVEKFVDGAGLAVPVFLDPDADFSRKNSITTLPGLLVVRDGKPAYRGRFPDDPDKLLGEVLN